MSINLTPEQIKEIKELDHIRVTWRDYALMLLNSTSNQSGLRDIWREKVITSYVHWTQGHGSISEVNLNGLEVMSELPSDFTMSIVDDYYVNDPQYSWRKLGRLPGSKRMKVHIGKYPQESLSNEAYLCIKAILNDWENKSHMIENSTFLTRMWKIAQMSDGDALTQDEVLTYILEKPVNDNKYGAWMIPTIDVFLNGIPSDKYKKYWRSDKIEGFPLNAKNRDELMEIISGVSFNPNDEHYSFEEMEAKVEEFIDKYECNLPIEKQIENMDKMCANKVLKEDLAYSPAWKKIAVCILKNDVSFKYAGFAPTLRERKAREEAIAAFETRKEEKNKAREEAKRLAKQIEKKRKQEEKSII